MGPMTAAGQGQQERTAFSTYVFEKLSICFIEAMVEVEPRLAAM